MRRVIADMCGRLIRPGTLELGGKSAAIILDDADLEATVKGLRAASFVNNRQTYHLSSRILAPRSRHGEVVVAGGVVPKDQPRGWFVSPTVFADVDNSARIAPG